MTTGQTVEKRTIGVWLELAPEQPLSSEGIGRLLGFFISGAAALGYQFLLSCPSWYQKELNDFIQELPPESRRSVSILHSRTSPSFFNPYRAHCNSKNSALPMHTRVSVRLRPILEWCSDQSPLTLLVCGLLALPVLLPIALIAGSCLALPGIFDFFKRTQFRPLVLIRNRIAASIRFYFRVSSSVLQRLGVMAVEQEYANLAKAASRRHDVLAWYVPNPGWSRCSRISKPIVTAVPDYVIADFPYVFKDLPEPGDPRRRIAKTLNAASYSISYRAYVRDKHVVEMFNYPAERAVVIPHAPVDLSSHIRVTDPSLKNCSTRERAAEVVRCYCKQRFSAADHLPFHQRYLPEFPFEDVRFLLLSTQSRGYKNVLRAVQAVELLVRTKYFNVKLFTTGYLEPEIAEYVQQRHLEYDVIPMNRVPADVHASLYHLAELAIHPSFFEGGFPFVASEALSVGTPVLLAKVAAVTEVLDGQQCDEFLFDPYSVEELANKILSACANREELLRKQRRLISSNSRTWENVAAEYIEIMKLAAGYREPSANSEASEESLLVAAACADKPHG